MLIQASIMIGTTIGNYKILKELGSGGMGTVYLAENISIGLKVAIKVLHAHLIKSQNLKKRFLKEARTQAILDHPNITKVIDYVDNSQGLFIILEYIEGEELNDYLFKNKGLMPEKDANHYMSEILDAVSYAHSKGVIHRDLKSANIMITPNRGIKIMDFGIAKLAGESLSLTKTGSRIGSPLYMSPEQVTSGNVDHRSDIYSLGVVYHEMLTGLPVYDQNNTTEFEIYNKIVREPLPRLKSFYKLISENSQIIVDTATSKLPEGRYQNCLEFKNVLNPKNQVENTSNKNRLKIKPKKKNNTIGWILGILFLIISIAGGTYVLLNNSNTKNSSTNNLIKANQFYNAQDYKKANQLYTLILSNDKTNIQAKQKIKEIATQSEKIEIEKIKNVLSNYITTNTLGEIHSKDSINIQKALQNYDDIKYKLNNLKNDERIVNYRLVDIALENLVAIKSFSLATALIDKSRYEEAKNLLTNTNKNHKLTLPLILKIDSLVSKNSSTQINEVIPFNLVEKSPKYGKCNGSRNRTIKKCFKKNINNYLLQNSNLNLYNTLGLKNENKTITYSFIINKNGKVENIKVNAAHPTIVSDIKNILNAIKNIIPAYENNQKVAVYFDSSFSIYLGKKKIKNEITGSNKEDKEEISIIIPNNLTILSVDQAPVFNGCGNKEGYELATCTEDKINSYISSKTKEFINLNMSIIKEVRHKIVINFIINSEGKISNIGVSTKNKHVKEGVENIIKTIPQMQPALYRSVPVSVQHQVSIKINLKS
ncbi:MAG: serine/threonine protein kinase [Flavobacteriaceae bacterium]|nr:serine/threonine protein kinase [Flavobacteriaceae bacterium]